MCSQHIWEVITKLETLAFPEFAAEHANTPKLKRPPVDVAAALKDVLTHPRYVPIAAASFDLSKCLEQDVALR